MNEDTFVNKYMGDWKELESFLKTLSIKPLSSFSKNDIKAFTYTFRKASHHLSYARTHFKGSNTENYLNQLLGKCHNYIYTREKKSFKDIIGYFLYDYPKSVMQYKMYILFSFAAFMAGICLSAALVVLNNSNVYYFLTNDMVESINLDVSGNDWNYPILSSVIMANNIRVSLLCVILGFFAGLGTLYILFVNGATIGALCTYVALSGESLAVFFSLLLPHAFLELTAIFISGGCGIIIGRSILIPGDFRRKDSLIRGSKEAIRLVPGVIAMLIAAGIIEGFFTPLSINPYIKIIFGLISLAAVMSYFFVFSNYDRQ